MEGKVKFDSDIQKKKYAYRAGENAVEGWINTNGQGAVPLLDHPKTIEDHYYNLGFKSRFEEVTGKSINYNTGMNNQNTGKKRRPNILDMEINKNGKRRNFLDSYGKDQRSYNNIINLSKRTLRDMMFGNVNVGYYREVFMNETFIRYMTNTAKRLAEYHGIMYKSLEMYSAFCNMNKMGAIAPGVTQSVNANMPPEGQNVLTWSRNHNLFMEYHLANYNIYNTLYVSLSNFGELAKSGIFDPEVLNRAQSIIREQRWRFAASDPYGG